MITVHRAPFIHQAIQFSFDHLVTFTHFLLQSAAVKDFDVAPRIVNQTCILQVARRHSDALPAAAEHVGNELLCHQHLV